VIGKVVWLLRNLVAVEIGCCVRDFDFGGSCDGCFVDCLDMGLVDFGIVLVG